MENENSSSFNDSKPKVIIICCLHGDEVFGKKVFDFYQKERNKISNLKLILANEQALHRRKRYIDHDLNRSFPGSKNGNHEDRVAFKLLSDLKKNASYILDIHTTTSPLVVTPIIAKLTYKTKKIINLTPSKEVVVMNEDLLANSLIGQFPDRSVSIEFNCGFAKTSQAFKIINNIVSGIVFDLQEEKLFRKVFYINQKINLNTKIPQNSVNFSYSRSVGGYPFLLYEKAYKDFQGFVADRPSKKLI